MVPALMRAINRLLEARTMMQFRYAYLATFAAAATVVFLLDLPVWARIIIMLWTAAPVVINEFQIRRKATDAAEASTHATTSVPDQLFHAYREH